MSYVIHALDGFPLTGILVLVALTSPALLRQLLLFIGFTRVLRDTRNENARVSMFIAFSAAMTPRRLPGESSHTDGAPPDQNAPIS
ncbi:hypothetical protein [Streptomyces tauricus]|uniref:hypothetical protein n=1 Tax=Streptomyces tauricus TaxID=68274 RepID=UPI0022445E06|nr:hypothetical protein [Streptomyces tauricus]MCW8101656.1 hypothetical protein [Streptomyces tauricus]